MFFSSRSIHAQGYADYFAPGTEYDADGEDITKYLPDDDYNRPEPSTIPNENGEYNF